MNKAIAFAVAILGLQVVVGFTGQIALGQSFFFGMGAYLAAWLVEDHGWPYLLTLVVIIPVCFGFGMIFGIPALRIKGLYLALVTLGLAAIFPSLVQLDVVRLHQRGGRQDRVGQAQGARLDPHDGVSKALQKIPVLGQYWRRRPVDQGGSTDSGSSPCSPSSPECASGSWATWSSPDPGEPSAPFATTRSGAAVSGIDLSLYKTLSFGVASALGGVGGMIYVAELGIASPNDFTCCSPSTSSSGSSSVGSDR
ncbi:MAG: branched-chain amino acid ABC transporter permease [Ilumatobacteraceae bacterium]